MVFRSPKYLVDPLITVEMTGKNLTVISEFLIALSAAGIETAQNKTSELIQEEILKATQDLKKPSQKRY
jgi:hypothetical protein